MWLLFFPALVQALICPIGLFLPRIYDTELLSFGPASCPTSNFERYDGNYAVLSSSNPNVQQISCDLGPAQLMFDNRPQTAWNSGSTPALLEKSRKGGSGHSLQPSLTESTELSPAFVIFQTVNIAPTGMTLKNYGDTTHDTTSASLAYGPTANGPWTVVRSISPVANTSNDQYFSLSVSQPQTYWKLSVVQPSGGVFYGRDFQFYMNPVPIRLLPSLGDFPNTYYPLDGNANSFDNSTATYQEFSGSYFTFLFFAQTYLNIDKITGVYIKTEGDVSTYGISQFKLRPLETELLQVGSNSFMYGLWTTQAGASSGFGPITNWNDNPTYTFIFSAKPVGSSSTMRLAELSLVGCPKYSCPCSTTSQSGYTSVTCAGGATACAMIDKPFMPISL